MRKTFLALVLVGLLGLSFLSMLPNASALSPVTFSDKSTFTSLNSGRWFQVWTNSTGYSYFVDINQGNFKSVILDQYGNTTSTATATLSSSTNPSAVSAIEVVAGVPRVYTAQQQSTTLLEVNIVNLKTAAVISSANMTISATQAITGSPIAVAQTKNAVYYMAQGTGAGQQVGFHYSARDLTGFTTITNTYATGHNTGHLVKMIAATNGASAATDVIYALDASNNSAAPGLTQITTAGATDLGNVGAAAATTTLDLTDLEDKAVFRFIQSGTTKTFTITKATDAISAELYDDTWLTYAVQPFDFDGTTFTYSEDKSAYFATATQAIAWQADGVFNISAAVMPAESLDTSTGIISGPDATYYKISNSLVVEGSGTTWTPRLVSGTTETVAPTPYEETLNVPLQVDSTLFSDDVIRLDCDANYHVRNPYIVGNATDCTVWRTVAESTDEIGRNIYQPFSLTADVVHANPYTAYLFQISAADPTIFTLRSLYDGKTVAVDDFDAAGSAQMLYLYGNCYQIQVYNSSTSQTISLGEICANDDTEKVINFNVFNIPPGWPNYGWNYAINRSFGAVNSTVQFDYILRSETSPPYSADVLTTDNWLSSAQTYQTWYNVTNAPSTTTIMTTIPNNQTIYFIVYDTDGVPRLTASSAGRFDSLASTVAAFEPLGTIFGISPIVFFVVLASAVFVKTNSPFGLIVVAGLTGLLFALGALDLSNAVWGALVVVAAVGAVYVIRRN